MSKADRFKSLAQGSSDSNQASMKRAFEGVTGLGSASTSPGSSNSSDKALKKSTFRFSEGFHTALKLYAVSKGRPMDDIIEQAVREYMEKNP